MVNSSKKRKPYWLDNQTMLANRYQVLDVVEEGGFGIVYLGQDCQANKKISIKEYFPRELASREPGKKEISVYRGDSEWIFEKGLEKFLSEAQILSGLKDLDSIVVSKDFFYENNTAYIIMEYIAGKNVKEYISEYGKMRSAQVLDVMKPIFASLEKIHNVGLIHRDISPENIIITEEKRAYLVDFGIARPYTGSDFKTITVFFKRGYAAEEQYREKGEQGPWTDIYALCATMYYMLTGIHPVEAAQRNIKDTLIPLTQMKDIACDEEVKWIIRKGMSIDFSKRYASVSEIYADLYENRGVKRKRSLYWMMKKIPEKRMVLAVVICGFVLLSIGSLWFVTGFHTKEEKDNLITSTGKMNTTAPQATDASTDKLTVDPLAEEKNGQKNLSVAEQETTSKTYTIPNVIGKTLKKAKKQIRKNGDKTMRITVNRIYSKKIKKGYIIRQSLRGGFQYQAGDVEELVLTVSRGKKVQSNHTIPKSVQQTAPDTQTASTPKPQKTKKDSDDYAGILPY